MRARLCPVFAAAALAFACAEPPPIAELALVTTRADVVRPKILATAVTGEHCFSEDAISVTLRPPWRARLADHGRAIAAAIASVPGADVLVNVRLYGRVEQYLLFQRICAIVTGDAGKLL